VIFSFASPIDFISSEEAVSRLEFRGASRLGDCSQGTPTNLITPDSTGSASSVDRACGKRTPVRLAASLRPTKIDAGTGRIVIGRLLPECQGIAVLGIGLRRLARVRQQLAEIHKVASAFQVVRQPPGLVERPGLKGRYELALVDDAKLKSE
jgi:hypothetical protein